MGLSISNLLAKGPVGPLEFQFANDVKNYLFGNPTPPNYDCLKDFFRALESTQQILYNVRTTNGRCTVHHCGHTIVINETGKIARVTLVRKLSNP